jgi:hypothetical protein
MSDTPRRDDLGFLTWRGSALFNTPLKIIGLDDEPTSITVLCGNAPLSEIKIDGLRTLCKERGLKPVGHRRADLIAALESQD